MLGLHGRGTDMEVYDLGPERRLHEVTWGV